MKITTMLVALLICGTASAITEAADVSTFKLAAIETHTPVSGFAGAWKELGNDGGTQVLREIIWGEKADDPCGLYIDTADLNSLLSYLSPQAMPPKKMIVPYVFGKFTIAENRLAPYLDSAGQHHFSKYLKLDCNGNQKRISSVANDKSIYKLSVCTTDKKKSSDNKLKGIKVWTRSLDYKPYAPGKSPNLTDEPTPQIAFHKPHCDQWRKPIACNAGEVATGLRVHHNDIQHRDWVTGLSLVCRKVLVDKPISAAVPKS